MNGRALGILTAAYRLFISILNLVGRFFGIGKDNLTRKWDRTLTWTLRSYVRKETRFWGRPWGRSSCQYNLKCHTHQQKTGQ
jgi:hypothetical protein